MLVTSLNVVPPKPRAAVRIVYRVEGAKGFPLGATITSPANFAVPPTASLDVSPAALTLTMNCGLPLKVTSPVTCKVPIKFVTPGLTALSVTVTLPVMVPCPSSEWPRPTVTSPMRFAPAWAGSPTTKLPLEIVTVPTDEVPFKTHSLAPPLPCTSSVLKPRKSLLATPPP